MSDAAVILSTAPELIWVSVMPLAEVFDVNAAVGDIANFPTTAMFLVGGFVRLVGGAVVHVSSVIPFVVFPVAFVVPLLPPVRVLPVVVPGAAVCSPPPVQLHAASDNAASRLNPIPINRFIANEPFAYRLL